MYMNLPNFLTMMRLAAVPLLVVMYYGVESTIPAVFIFMLAGFTDWLDGYAARLSNQVTALGAFLDPVADKLLVVTVLFLVMGKHRDPLLSVLAITLVCREVFISSLREWLAHSASKSRLSVSLAAKLKTACQMAALTILLYTPSVYSYLGLFGVALLTLSVALSVFSAINYVKIAWPALTFSPKKE
ncbi:CDP-diacylglycerol--glycerol-3-phosphate 3-phosphatidyltransferase [Candidatus Synchoanobacter obligatus]|uniref:CDP-diacylglycerol--glycerol-3-phosphate 3-phosphatidyltransferase n=1 Tax=Candidatus Synchoanobacter obligatus TaxID=2919597 RepID=A0ABT1L626_9GAMM|nr:CDP-diacylglycerol--glycerol-3-phosphate 3-phosphatidyltransferase [Candidatus Synchoanobacter obligatus]MCP8352640.1 CDP-diacylglycerol--glycerol-3-phosphate 3-phosphatidyltransferase [Candidatus Synchoanobacter obligatus]